MALVDFLRWPGPKICERVGVDPKCDAGLIRSMFNMTIYLAVILGVMWALKVW